MPDMRTSAQGRALIEQFEGCVLHAYQDVVGVWTIGYGFTGVLSDGRRIESGLVITQAEADSEMLVWLADRFEPPLNRLLGDAATTQDEFDAMGSLQWNIGVGAFAHTSVARDHVAGNHEAAADAFLLWNKAGGRVLPALTRRRTAERALYLTGAVVPVAKAPPPGLVDYADVQRRLNDWGIDPALNIDDDYGPDTRDALRVFQADSKLPVTGLPDAATLAALPASVRQAA